MTLPVLDDHFYKEKLLISRNKVKLLLNFHLNAVVNSILESKNPALPIITRSSNLDYIKDPEKFGKNLNQIEKKLIQNLEIYLEIMVEIYLNLLKGQVRTKRDLYYGNSSLFKKQATLDTAITNLAKHFKVPRDALNVVGSAKGIYYGKEIQVNEQSSFSSSNLGGQVNLIPRREEIFLLDLSKVKLVLVVEKDAVMNVIVENYHQIQQDLGGIHFLLISGKGFPCMRTKQFLNLIESQFPNIPKYILVDNDPYGIDISLNYVTSSEDTEMDSCASLQYIGVNHFDLDKYGIQNAYIPLTTNDLKRLDGLKSRAKLLNRQKELEEIIFMQNNMKKSEIEALYNPDCKTFCQNFLVNKLQGLVKQTKLMEAEDIALKNRLQVDERIIRKVSKKLLSTKNCKFKNEELGVFSSDVQQLEFAFDKNLSILKSFSRDWQEITDFCGDIEQNIIRENESIEAFKLDIVKCQEQLQNRLQYDLIAKEILNFQSRNEINQKILEVETEIKRIIDQIEIVDERTQQRHSDCSRVFESFQLLLESVNFDTKELNEFK